MGSVFEHQVSVRWRDVDALGHVNHAVFLTTRETVLTPAGESAADARVVTVHWDPDKRKPVPWSAADRARLTA